MNARLVKLTFRGKSFQTDQHGPIPGIRSAHGGHLGLLWLKPLFAELLRRRCTSVTHSICAKWVFTETSQGRAFAGWCTKDTTARRETSAKNWWIATECSNFFARLQAAQQLWERSAGLSSCTPPSQPFRGWTPKALTPWFCSSSSRSNAQVFYKPHWGRNTVTHWLWCEQPAREPLDFFSILNAHGLFMERSCAMAAYTELTKFLKGYGMLAGASLNDTFNGWAIKPKLHLVKHAHLEIQEWLLAGHQVLVNFNLHNCEQDEDYIGRVCRLSRRLDSRRIGERVLQSCLLKSHLLYKNFLKDNKICQRWRWKWIVGSDGVWERFPDVPQWFPNILFHPFSWQSCLIIVMFRLGYILQSPNTSEWSSIGIVAR